MSRPRTVAIIQARMGSARFPRKVLADLAGQPVIWHLIHRLRQCQCVDEVMLATSDQMGDDDLAGYVTRLGVRVVRGSETDVLQRILKSAREAKAEIIVRVTGDAPLVDPASVDAQVRGLLEHQAGFCIAEQGVPDINEGFEAFTMAALTKLGSEASADPIAVEHTCTYFKKHPGFVNTVMLPVPEDLQFKGARLSVDTPADLEFLNLLHERLGARAGEIDVRSVVLLLRKQPELMRVNAAVVQKVAGLKNRTVLIRCDASPEIGHGHLIRCLALAEALREEQSMGITFVTRASLVCSKLISECRHRHLVLADDVSMHWTQIEDYIRQTGADVLVLDLRGDGITTDFLADLRDRCGVLLVDVDDMEEKRLACDLVFSPPVRQVKRLDWNKLHGRLFWGWDWVLMRRQFQQVRQKRVDAPRRERFLPEILVTMGGSDPAGMTLQAVTALQKVTMPFHAVFVLGGSFCHQAAFDAEIQKVSYSHEIHRAVDAMAELMAKADLALACFSVTAYELAAIGVPAIYLSLTDDHFESSQAFVDAGLGISLGHHEHVDEAAIIHAVSEILVDSPRRLTMSQAALDHCDALGAQRIAAEIAQTLQYRS